MPRTMGRDWVWICGADSGLATVKDWTGADGWAPAALNSAIRPDTQNPIRRIRMELFPSPIRLGLPLPAKVICWRPR